jgi:integrase
MGSVHKHSSGRSQYFFAKFRDSDGRIVVRSTKMKKWADAVEVCNKWERLAEQGAAGALAEAQARKVVAEIFQVATKQPLKFEIAQDWMNKWLTMKEASKAPGTYKRYKLLVDRFLLGLGKKAKGDLATITMTDVQNFRDAELKEGVSPSSADLAVKTLRIPFNLACSQGILTVNPAEGVELLLKKGEKRSRFTEEQITQLIASSEGEWTGCIRVGFYTGARLGNCARLRWSEVDWKKGAVRYLQQKQKHGSEPVPVICPMHPKLQEDLQERRKGASGEFVFPSLASKSISGKTGLSSQFQEIMSKAKIEVPLGKKKKGRGRQFHLLGFHSLKHTFNSHLANSNVSQEIRRKLVGHASDEVNDIYTHLDMPSLKSAIGHLPTV